MGNIRPGQAVLFSHPVSAASTTDNEAVRYLWLMPVRRTRRTGNQ